MVFEKFDYDEHAKNCDPHDFWLQVNRQMYGKPVSEEQIALIVSAVRTGLALESHDVVLDLGCGNGALSDRIFAECGGGHGVDASAFLIDVARTHFNGRTGVRYTAGDAVGFVTSTNDPRIFTKVLCYGALMHFPDDAVRMLLDTLRTRFTNVTHCFFGNILDKARLHDFYVGDTYVPGIEHAHDTALGLWRSEGDVLRLAQESVWHPAIRRMPAEFYGAGFRFDAVLTRP